MEKDIDTTLLSQQLTHYNLLTDIKRFFDEPVNTNARTYENIRKIATGQVGVTQQDVY